MARRRDPIDIEARRLLARLAELYDQVDRLYADHRCPMSTRCCRFGITRREPYLTSIELLAIRRALAGRGGPLSPRRQAAPLDPARPDERTCPLLNQEQRCAVYDARPFGCRTHWCHDATAPQPVPHRELQALVRQLQSLAAEHEPGGDAGRPLTRALP